MTKKFYITSAIPYVNAPPHIGHAQEFVYTDVIRRYHKLIGRDVTYLCGADENALKIVQAAEEAGKKPQEFCDSHQQEFLDLAKKLNVQVDIWQRASDTVHHFPSSQKLWELCDKNGDIYKKPYTGLYCVGCEIFYTPEELDENGECLEHPGKKLDKVSEKNYFFQLKKYQKFLEELIKTDQLKIIPEIRKNEALSFVRRGLEDFSISRSKERAKNWGVPVPNDSSQIMYVWFDALNIYQSGIGFGWNDKFYKKLWPQDLMVIGKGILRFHAIYWPAILKSAGLALPKSLFVHGYLTVNGQKMSKTLGNIIDPVEIINKYGTDALRYYLLREIPSWGDGDFSEKRFKEVYNADLANGLGNLLSRVAKLCETSGHVHEITNIPRKLKRPVSTSLEKFHFDKALSYIWSSVKWGLRWLDRDINEAKPWQIQDKKLLHLKLHLYVENILDVAYNLKPFLPETAEKIEKQFAGPKIKSGPPLFPRI